jgi:hypothetical protein
MESTPNGEPALTTAHLPQPRGRSRWRWSTPRRAAVAGGTMAAVLGLSTGVAGAAGGPTSSEGTSAPASKGQPPSGTRPTVGGRITALSGDDITVRTRDANATTVVYSASTTFTALSTKGTNTSTSSSASDLKVGDFIGVVGTKQSNGTVSATSIMVSTGPPGGRGGPPSASGRGGTGTRPTQGAAPSA